MPPKPMTEEEAFRGFVLRKSGGRVSGPTLDRYWNTYVVPFKAWLGDEPITPAIVDAYYQQVVCPKYVVNSRQVVCPALNWFLRFKRVRDEDGEQLRFPIPPKEIDEEKRLIDEEHEWPLLKRQLEKDGDLRELALVLVQRDTFLRPCDIVKIRVSQVILDVERPHIDGKVQKKTKRRVKPFLTRETANVLRRYIGAHKPTVYLFEVSPGQSFHRRWPLEVIQRADRRAGLSEDITPRTFRRTGATRWKGDVKDLQAQGGWADPKTIWQHYRQWQDERHWEAFEKTFEPKRKEEAEFDDPAFR